MEVEVEEEEVEELLTFIRLRDNRVMQVKPH